MNSKANREVRRGSIAVTGVVGEGTICAVSLPAAGYPPGSGAALFHSQA